MPTAQKFNKALVLQNLESKLQSAYRRANKAEEAYPAELEKWKVRAQAYCTKKIDAGEQPASYGCPSPPTKPAKPDVRDLERAIEQLRMIEGDTVSFRPDDSILRLAS